MGLPGRINSNRTPGGKPTHPWLDWQKISLGGMGIAQCVQNITIKNNEFRNFRNPAGLQVDAGTSACNSRPVTNYTFDGNFVTSTDPNLGGTSGFHIGRSTTSDNAYVGDVTIINNFFSLPVAGGDAILDENNRLVSPNPSTIIIAGNTFEGNFESVIRVEAGDNPIQNYTIQNNVMAGSGTARNIFFRNHQPSNLIADGNVYIPNLGYLWSLGNLESTLAGWQAATGQDLISVECVPSLVNPATGDLHLLSNDTCAIGAGVDITSITMLDIDGQPRSATSPDSGADEVQGGSVPPDPPQNVRLFP